MSEVLDLHFHATSDSLLTELDAIEALPNGVTRVLLGAPRPRVQCSLDELATFAATLDPKLVPDFRAWLARLHDVIRAKAAVDASDVMRVQEKANRVAQDAHELEQKKTEAHAAIQTAKEKAEQIATETEVERLRLSIEAKARQEQHDADMKAIAEKQAAAQAALDDLHAKVAEAQKTVAPGAAAAEQPPAASA